MLLFAQGSVGTRFVTAEMCVLQATKHAETAAKLGVDEGAITKTGSQVCRMLDGVKLHETKEGDALPRGAGKKLVGDALFGALDDQLLYFDRQGVHAAARPQPHACNANVTRMSFHSHSHAYYE